MIHAAPGGGGQESPSPNPISAPGPSASVAGEGEGASKPFGTPVRRLGALARTIRIMALILGITLVSYGTLCGDDDLWPFAPMSQFAFRVGPEDSIRAVHVTALTTEGSIVEVPLTAEGVGLGRAELEGQLPSIVQNPQILQDIAIAHQRLHPSEPRYRTIWLKINIVRLHHGRTAGTEDRTLATWQVPGAN